jgi:hypothetical protein
MRAILRMATRRAGACGLLSLMPFCFDALPQDLVLNNQLALTSIAVQGTNLTLGASVPAGLRQVTLEMRPALAASWKAAAMLDVAAGGGEVSFTIQKPGDMQFFRLHAVSAVASAGVLSAELNYLTVAPLGSSQTGLAGPNAGPAASNAVFHFKGLVDGSDRILITREGALWEHAHWDWPQGAVTVNSTQWNPQEKNYLSTAGAAKFLPDCFSLEAAKLERIKGRDVVALERTNATLIVYLDDTPVGAGEYEFKIHFHPARPAPAQAGSSTAATLKIAAQIDGSECLRITATEATWDHKHWGWPTGVTLNDVPWSLQQTNLLQNAGTNVFLPSGVDFSTARIVSRKGRDLATMWAEERALWVWFVDSPNGDDHYELEIAFGH